MSDRLLGISPIVAGAGVAGLVVAIALYVLGAGSCLSRSTISRADAVARARAYAAGLGFDVRSSGTIVRPTWIETPNYEALVSRYGNDRLRSAIESGELPAGAWIVTFRTSLLTTGVEDDPGALAVTLAPNGDVVGADFYNRFQGAEPITRDAALASVEERLRAVGVDPTGYAIRGGAERAAAVGASTSDDGGLKIHFDEDEPPAPGTTGARDPQPPDAAAAPADTAPRQREDDSERTARTHSFVLERSDPAWPDVVSRIEAKVSAAGIVSFDRSIDSRLEGALSAPGFVAQVIEGIAMVLIAILLVLILLGALAFRVITRDFVSLWRALTVGLLFLASVEAATIVLSRWEMPGVGIFALTLLAGFSVGILVVAGWVAGEGDAYYAWGKHSTEAAVALLSGRPHSRQVARAAIEGTFWGWILLGAIVAVSAVVAAVFGPDIVMRRVAPEALDARPAWLFAIGVLPFVATFSVLFLLFVPAWLHRLTRRAWIAVPLGAIIAAPFASQLGLADLRFGVVPGSLAWGVAFSAVAIVLVLRRGFLTAAFATLTFSTFFYGLAAVLTAAPSDRYVAASGLAVLLAPAIAALVAGPRLPEANVRDAPPPRVSALMERARRHEELDIARRVQSGLLPAREPSVPGFDIAGTCLPANEVGGDYYDYFPFEDGHFGLAVGDVSGKGIPAAFCMTLTKGFMEVAAANTREPDRVLTTANGYLRQHLARGTFVTMAYALLDPEALTLRCARAGHNPPAVLRSGLAPTFVLPSGTALGAAEDARFAELMSTEQLVLDRGDAVVFYTDGVTEAMSTNGEQFGEERLLETLARLHDGRPARALADALVEAVTLHARDAEQHDDITVVVVRAHAGGADE